MKTRLDLVLPVHNEGPHIRQVLRELHRTITESGSIDLRFVVSEDGSRDDTVSELEAAAREFPLTLISSPQRKGYSRAVVDGLRETTAPYVAFVDSDGQYAPEEFALLFRERERADLVVGRRARRCDTWTRILMSRAFKVVFRLFFREVRLGDPSCSFLVVEQQALRRILTSPHLGMLREGFWWEFAARAQHAGLRMVEVPVTHRTRRRGVTKVYLPGNVPRIAAQHLMGLRALQLDLRKPGRSDR